MEDILIDAHLSPVPVSLSFAITGRVESRHSSDMHLNGLSERHEVT